MFRWYVLHTQSGKEFNAKTALEKKIEFDQYAKVGEIIVPVYKETIYKDGKKKKAEKKSFPGYICVNMEMDFESKDYASDVPFVSGFLADRDKLPLPIREAEMEMIISKTEEKVTESGSVEIDFELGQKVLIVDGPFNNFSGLIKNIYPDKGKLSVDIEIFGRKTPVEIDYYKVKKQ